ncbi:MAG: hypothetical protein WD851_01015 [Pirellulales bacterium]
MSDQNKKRFYQSWTFWIGVAAIVFIIGDMLGVLIPAWQATQEMQERDRAAEQAEQK